MFSLSIFSLSIFSLSIFSLRVVCFSLDLGFVVGFGKFPVTIVIAAAATIIAPFFSAKHGRFFSAKHGRRSFLKLVNPGHQVALSLIHISEPTRPY